MKIYLDDERQTPDGWVQVHWPDEAIKLLKSGDVTEISLDHDLGDDDRGTGYDVVLWIEEQVALRGFVPPAMTVHSANGKEKVCGLFSCSATAFSRDRTGKTTRPWVTPVSSTGC